VVEPVEESPPAPAAPYSPAPAHQSA